MGEKLKVIREENVRKWDGCVGGGTDRESKKKRYLDRESHYKVREKSGVRETPRNPQRCF